MFIFLIREESGQGAAEYCLILALTALAAVTAFGLFGQKVLALYENSKTAIP